MIVVDSSVWINWFRTRPERGPSVIPDHVDPDEIVIGDIVLLEILKGARSEDHARRLQRHLLKFTTATMLNHDVAVIAARNFRHLRSLGFTLRNSADLIIGTFCIENGHALLQQDRDFLPMAEHLGLWLI